MSSHEQNPACPGEILIVEDTLASLQLLSDLLTQAGYAVRQAQDGEMALLSARQRPPELVLLDIRMPGINGYEVCRQLKADPRTRDVPVIFLSALHETENKVQGFRLGAVDFIAKPYQPDEVLARVRTHIELRRLQTGLEQRVRERTTDYEQSERKLQQSWQQLQELTGFLQTVREEERTRIAREIHDELGQALTALRIDLAWLGSRYAGGEPRIAEKLLSAHQLVVRTLDAVRRISEDLRPGMLDDLGLAAAIENHVAKFTEHAGIPCTLSMNREEFEVGDSMATAIFRLTQEALTNVARHAAAHSVAVEILDDGAAIHVTVQDDGCGLAPPADRKTFGLLGMRERVKMFGGKFEMASVPGKGTRIEATFPQNQQEVKR
ncbi:MAG: response regulator [Sulfuricella sp.]|jgi:signal transduction histidine kinase|nr:response regulator [Sulfuricella sp.]